jgi:MtaA/CmuA family methyltransferase
MNSLERLNKRLRGDPVDRIPNLNIFMRFAAHYIDQPLSSYYLDYRILAEANLALLEPFKIDIVQAVSDPYRETADFGAEILFPDDDPPLLKQPLVQEPGDLLKITPPNPYNGRRMSDRLMAVRYFREQVGGEVPIMGWVEGALAQAANLRGLTSILADVFDRPEWTAELLEMAVQVEIEFARLQVAMGADIIGLGEVIASQLPPDLYRRFALPYQQRIIAAVHEMGALARLHICGDTSRILTDMLASGADIVDVDWMVNFSQAASVFGSQAAPCGNMNPVRIFLQGSPLEVEQDVRRALSQGGERCLNAAGCEIPDGTPYENLLAQSNVLQLVK